MVKQFNISYTMSYTFQSPFNIYLFAYFLLSLNPFLTANINPVKNIIKL